ANRHVVRLELPKKLGDGCRVTRHGEAHWLTRESNGTKASAWKLTNELCDLRFRACDAAWSNITRVHALRVVEHNHDIEVRGRNELRSTTPLRSCEPEECAEDRHDEQNAFQCATTCSIERLETHDELRIAKDARRSTTTDGSENERRRKQHHEQPAAKGY